MGACSKGAEAIEAAVRADAERVQARTLQPGCAALFVSPIAAPSSADVSGPPPGEPSRAEKSGPSSHADSDASRSPSPSSLSPSASGVVLLLHGWSAGPWQYIPLAAALRARGLFAYAARLPGHGACFPDGKEDGRELPLTGDWRRYRDCADAAFEAARALADAQGVPLYVMGFSGGGALATDLLLRYPQAIRRAVLAAPLLRPRSAHHRALFAALCALPGTGLLTDRIDISWGTLPVTPPGGWVRPGHWFFKLGALQSMVHYSLDVWRRAKTLDVPTQFIVTDLDDKADDKAAAILRGTGDVRHHFWRFSASEGVPHAMLTAEENPNGDARAQIFAMVERFLLRGEGADRA